MWDEPQEKLPNGGNMKSSSTMKGLFLAINIVLASTAAVSAQSYKFRTIDFPGSVFNRPHNINRYGDIVGLFYFSRPGAGHGYLLHEGVWQQIDYPGATFTSARGVNASLQIV